MLTAYDVVGTVWEDVVTVEVVVTEQNQEAIDGSNMQYMM